MGELKLPAKRESQIQNEFNAEISAKLGIECCGLKKRGWPDRVYMIPGGRPLFIEWKRPGEEPRGNQKLTLYRLHNLGYDIAVCTSREEGLHAIERAMSKAGGRKKPPAGAINDLLFGDWRRMLGLDGATVGQRIREIPPLVGKRRTK